MQLQNLQTGKTESLEHGDALTALAAGTHKPTDGQRVVVGPDGKPGIVAPDDLASVLGGGAGYQIPSQDQLTELAKQAKYGEGTANEVKAAAAGAARGATFGVSDAVLPALGVSTKEALREREARNPAASITGELAGMAGSTMLLPGGGAVGAVGRAGEAVTEALAPRALGEGASLASRILNRAGQVGAKALGSGVEGAAFGAGQSVSEAALGDPDLTAQKVMGNIGLGALWGGALGGLMKVGELSIPPAVGKARDAAASTWRTLFGGEIGDAEPMVADLPAPPGTEPAAAAATGTDAAGAVPDQPAGDGAPLDGPLGPFDRRSAPRALSGDAAQPIPLRPGAADPAGPFPTYQDGIIPKLIARAKEGLGGPSAEETLEGFRGRGAPKTGEILNPKEYDGFVRDSVKSLQHTYDSIDQASQAASSFARPAESAKLLEGADPVAAQSEAQRIAQRLDQVATEMESRPALYPARFPAKLQDIAADFQTQLFEAENAADHFAAVNKVKKLVDGLAKWNGAPNAADADALQVVRGLRGEIRRSLESGDVWGEAGARQAGYNRATADYLDAAKEFRKRFMSKAVVRGQEVYRVDPTKVKTYFNAINDARGEFRGSVIDEWLRAGHELTGEMERTHQVAQIRDYDPEAFRTKLSANQASLDRARGVVSAQPGQGYGFFTSLFLGHTLGGPMATVATVAKALTDPQKLAAMERAAGKTTNAVAKGAKALFRPVEASAAKASSILKDQLTPQEKLERFEKRAQEIQTRAGAPEAMIDELDEATRSSFDVAPKITQGLQQTAIRGTMFLASKLPQPPPQMPLDRKFEPSQAQIAQFDRYHDAVHDPLSVMAQLKSGRVHPETLEALSAVYPELLSEMRQEVMSELTGRMGSETLKLSYQQKLSLGQFLGQPLSSSALPQNVAANQTAMGSALSEARQQPAGGAPGTVKTSQKGLEKLDLASRMAGPNTKIAERSNA